MVPRAKSGDTIDHGLGVMRAPPLQVSYTVKGRASVHKAKGLLPDSSAQARFQMQTGEWRTVQQHNEARC